MKRARPALIVAPNRRKGKVNSFNADGETLPDTASHPSSLATVVTVRLVGPYSVMTEVGQGSR